MVIEPWNYWYLEAANGLLWVLLTYLAVRALYARRARRRAETDAEEAPEAWPPAGMHLGVALRLDTPHGPLLIADSDRLHYIAKYRGPDGRCSIDCPAGCERHSWSELFPGDDMAYMGSRDVVLLAKPMLLPD